jgi:hypothetical protein
MGEHTRLDRAVDRAADAGRGMLAFGGVVVLFTLVFGRLQYRHVYGTFRPLVRFPPRFYACGESTYLLSRPVHTASRSSRPALSPSATHAGGDDLRSDYLRHTGYE